MCKNTGWAECESTNWREKVQQGNRKELVKGLFLKKYYDISYLDLRYIWNMSSEASRFTHNTLQILEKTNIGKSFLVLPCRKMCRCISNVEWFPSFSQFYEGKHHNGFHTCRQHRPSLYAWPEKLKITIKFYFDTCNSMSTVFF